MTYKDYLLDLILKLQQIVFAAMIISPLTGSEKQVFIVLSGLLLFGLLWVWAKRLTKGGHRNV